MIQVYKCNQGKPTTVASILIPEITQKLSICLYCCPLSQTPYSRHPVPLVQSNPSSLLLGLFGFLLLNVVVYGKHHLKSSPVSWTEPLKTKEQELPLGIVTMCGKDEQKADVTKASREGCPLISFRSTREASRKLNQLATQWPRNSLKFLSGTVGKGLGEQFCSHSCDPLL